MAAKMTELLTSAQMRAIEAAAMESGAVTGVELMERAGAGVVAALLEEWPELAEGAQRAVVLCGPGNNGGDGFVVARLLRERGWAVEVFLYGDAATLPPDAQVNHDRWGGAVHPLSSLDWATLAGQPLVVDALFGTGLSRPAAAGIWGSLAMAQESYCRIVAVDIPSGLCADSGRVLSEGGHLEAPVDLTVTFERAKTGHALATGGVLRGRLRVVPIGLARQMDDLLRQSGEAVVEEAGPRGDLAKRSGHKFDHGHALILSGPAGRGGAARLAARGALRVGAGLVTVGCPADAMAEHAARLDAIMLRAVEEGQDLNRLLSDSRITTLCLGPGMGTGARETGLVRAALVAAPRLVLDADALTILSQQADLFAALHERCVLTPHAGEFARLFPDIAERLAAPATTGPAYSKVDATREAAKRAGCVVLYKGPDTVIATPDGRAAINSAHDDRAAPWLATAGSGDVLAGFIAGLLARGFPPFDAACTGAWLHVECAREFGPGLIAEDLPEMLPAVFRRLGM